jgi:serine/threonine protein kinase
VNESDVGTESTRIRDPLVGVVVLGYEITGTLGVGGMGKVYEALERNIGRRAAVKVLLPEFAEDPVVVERLKAEARAANAVRHRGIIDIFGFAELPDGRQAIVMEYLDGISLEEELRRLKSQGRRMPLLEALQVLDEVASVLSAAHGAGVVHRDLKPSNVYLVSAPDGTRSVKVLDFGIAKSEQTSSLKTQQNTVLGTPTYIAPEQAAGLPASPSMDLYALGVIAFELFVGSPPFAHDNVMALLLMHQQRPPPVPSSLVRSLPAVIDAFVLTMLAKQPRGRFPSADVVRQRLKELRRELGDGTAVQPAPGNLPAVDVLRSRAPRPLVTMSPPVLAPAVPNPSTPRGRAERPARWPLGVVGAVVVLGGGALAWRLTHAPDVVPTAPVAPAPLPVALAPVAVLAPVEPPKVRAVAALDDDGSAPPAPGDAAPSPPDAGASPDVRRPESAPARVPRAPRVTELVGRPREFKERLDKLAKRLRQRQAEGSSVDLELTQVESLQRALGADFEGKRLNDIEVALERIEGEVGLR